MNRKEAVKPQKIYPRSKDKERLAKNISAIQFSNLGTFIIKGIQTIFFLTFAINNSNINNSKRKGEIICHQ